MQQPGAARRRVGRLRPALHHILQAPRVAARWLRIDHQDSVRTVAYVDLPNGIEDRLRHKWSRHARRKGYAIFAFYVLAVATWAYFMVGHPIIIFMLCGGFGLAFRHFRTAGHLLRRDEFVDDDETMALLSAYERRIRSDGQKEVGGGLLSLSAGEDVKGRVSFSSGRSGCLVARLIERTLRIDRTPGQRRIWLRLNRPGHRSLFIDRRRCRCTLFSPH